MTVKIGLIGLGSIAQKVYLPILGSHDGVEIAGLMSRSQSTVETLGRKYRIGRCFTELDELLRLELDAVFVHSPTETHRAIVEQCLDRGVHVYVDKPLAYDLGDAERMAERAERAGKLLAVGFNRRFAPMYIEAKAWLDEAGGFDLAVAQKHRVRQQRHGLAQTFYDDLIHMIDLLVWLSGGSYEARQCVKAADAEGRLLHATGQLGLGGASGLFSMVRYAGADLEKLELHGSKRSVEVTNMEAAAFYDQHRMGPRTASFGSWDSVLMRRGFTGAVDHFLDSLHDPARCSIRADRVLGTHRLTEQLIGL